MLYDGKKHNTPFGIVWKELKKKRKKVTSFIYTFASHCFRIYIYFTNSFPTYVFDFHATSVILA